MPKHHEVIIEDDANSKPRPHEDTAAKILASHFRSSIIFMRRRQSKTPDIYVLKTNLRWELKAPIGNGKHTIQNNLRDAGKQSENIVVDLRKSKMSERQAISRIKNFLKTENSSIKRLKIISKDQKVIDIK